MRRLGRQRGWGGRKGRDENHGQDLGELSDDALHPIEAGMGCSPTSRGPRGSPGVQRHAKAEPHDSWCA
jgi:hypothetical protein